MSERIFIRQPVVDDWQELLCLNQTSYPLHFPWVAPPMTELDCKSYIQRCQGEDYAGLLICQSSIEPKIIGVVNLSQIFYGGFQNAYLGYYANAKFAGRGLMSTGIRLAINYAFNSINLHRIEANIQPENIRSIELVKRLGFIKEGFSQRYLYLNGAWRDHERWALTVENWH